MSLQKLYSVGSPNVSDGPVVVTQGPKGAYQTLKSFTGTIATLTTGPQVQNLYTVTAGKTFYLTDVSICNNTANAAQVSVNGAAGAGVSPVLIGHSLNTAPLEVTNIGSEPSVAGGNPVTVQSLATAAVTTLTYFVAGYEQ